MDIDWWSWGVDNQVGVTQIGKMTNQPGDLGDSANLAEGASARPPSRRRPADTFAVRLILSRHLNGMTIGEAARASGINDATWATWEGGRRPRDILEVCRRISDALDIDYEWLLFGGSLAGPRGVATRPEGDTSRYPHVPIRPTDNRPIGRPREVPRRPAKVQVPGPTTSRNRRAVRIEQPDFPVNHAA